MFGMAENLRPAEKALLVAMMASAAMLAGAHLFERIGGFAPCILCLDQREAHWAGLAVAATGLIIARGFRSRIGAGATVGAAALVYLVSAGLAFYHVGVEYGYWEGPAQCAGGLDGPLSLETLSGALEGGERAPACSDVQWRLLGVSMAGYNFLASAGLFALTLAAAIAENRAAHRARFGEINA